MVVRWFLVPIGGLDAGDVDAEVLALVHRDHLGGGLEAELLHHGLEVVLARTLEEPQQERWVYGVPGERRWVDPQCPQAT